MSQYWILNQNHTATSRMSRRSQGTMYTVYREIYTLLNFSEFREFWQIVKFSFAKFHNVGVARRARGNSQIFLSRNLRELAFHKELATGKFPDIRYILTATSSIMCFTPSLCDMLSSGRMMPWR